VHEKARAEQLVAAAREAIKDEVGLDRARPLIADLQQLVHGLPASASSASAAGGNGAGEPHEGAGDQAEEGEVVDAEFTRD
jgi:molecular chaperone DnaK